MLTTSLLSRAWNLIVIAVLFHCQLTGLAGETAALVLHKGRIVTMDDRLPEAEAIATSEGRILAVGSNEDVSEQIGPDTRIIDLEGRLVIPGFIEGHGHFLSLGQAMMNLDLSGARSWDEVVDLVAETASKAPKGKWIIGRGWHQGKWSKVPAPNIEGYPVHGSLSRETPDHPVMLTHGSGHMLFANAMAMTLAGVGKNTREVAGGAILRDEQGRPIGIFRENAGSLIRRAYSRAQRQRTTSQVRADLATAVRLATEECLAQGVTSFQDAGSSFATVDLYRNMADRGQLEVRMWVMLDEGNDALARRMSDYRMVGYGDNHLTVRGIKRLIDGALGTHGAWLLQPYDDLPNGTGHNTTSLTSLRRTGELALEHGYQFCVHAIGDKANREVLDLYESLGVGTGDRDLRWRIEHAQHLNPADIPRFQQIGVIASMQAVHCTSDAPFVVERLGERRAKLGAYVWRSLLDAGAIVTNGTDTPVERVSPLACFYSAVTRKMRNGESFFAEQRMTREEALRSYTRDAAFAAFEEKLKGSLTPGKLADMVVLSKNILTIPPEEIRETKVLYTVVGGQVLYDSSESAK